VNDSIKLSSPLTREFWEIPVLFEDEHLLALDKPAWLLTSPDRYDPQRPHLLKLLHGAIAQNKPWTRPRGLTYLMNTHRLDLETSGVLLLAKNKPALIALASLFAVDKPLKTYLALVHGTPLEREFESSASLAPHPVKTGLMRVDPKHGKRARTRFEVRENFRHHTLLRCASLSSRIHQVRAHLQHVGWPIVGDALYGGSPLLLSRLKSNYRLKPKRAERPLIGRVALHAEQLSFLHPVSGDEITITAPWPKDLLVAVKYLRRYAGV
jgi:RluA family pseudouridine synthase